MTMDLGSAFAASVMRQPRQEAFVEGGRRATYADWYREIRSVAWLDPAEPYLDVVPSALHRTLIAFVMSMSAREGAGSPEG